MNRLVSTESSFRCHDEEYELYYINTTLFLYLFSNFLAEGVCHDTRDFHGSTDPSEMY